MKTNVPCRLCGNLPYLSSHSVCLGHGDYLEEIVLLCRNCHIRVVADNREFEIDPRKAVIRRWEKLMLD